MSIQQNKGAPLPSTPLRRARGPVIPFRGRTPLRHEPPLGVAVRGGSTAMPAPILFSTAGKSRTGERPRTPSTLRVGRHD